MHVKPHAKSPRLFIQISMSFHICIILLETVFSAKSLFSKLRIVLKFHVVTVAISNLRKVSLCLQEDIPRRTKLMLNSNLT